MITVAVTGFSFVSFPRYTLGDSRSKSADGMRALLDTYNVCCSYYYNNWIEFRIIFLSVWVGSITSAPNSGNVATSTPTAVSIGAAIGILANAMLGASVFLCWLNRRSRDCCGRIPVSILMNDFKCLEGQLAATRYEIVRSVCSQCLRR